MESPETLEWMIGKRCTSVYENAEGCFTFEIGGGGLHTTCAWRVVVDGRLAVAHRDHKQRFGLPAPLDACASVMEFVGGREITDALVDPVIGDIVITFAENRKLEVFNDSAGYEGWTMGAPDKYVLFAASGGEVSGYPGG
jgi:hypothetical protein